jgi:AraC-like DNA-binding protein
MEYAVVGKKIYPGMVVDILLEKKKTIDSCPGIFRAVHIESGSAFVSLDGGKRFLEAPALLCLDGREEIEFLKAEGFSCRTVYFKPSVINFQLSRDIALLPMQDRFHSPFFQDIFWLDPFVDRSPIGKTFRLDPGAAERVTALLDLLGKSLEEQVDAFWPCRSRSYFLELLFFIRNLSGATAGREAPEPAALAANLGVELPGKIEDILLYLHTNFREAIELEKLCRRFAINRTSLNGLFHGHLGQTVIQYLIGLRIRFACFLLRDTTVPVKELVWRSGFNDLAHFNRTFKKITSMTPLAYRKEYCFMLKG